MSTPGTDIVSANIDRGLEKHQVRMIETDDGRRFLHIPDELRRKAIVLTPVQELAQADPLWQPSVRLLFLDVDAHTYPAKQKGKRALGKLGIGEIAKLAGVDVVWADTVPSGEPGVIKARAVIRVRKSDGTFLERADTGVIREDVEAEEIEDSMRERNETAREPMSDDALAKAIRKRVRDERKHYHAKAITKAILRAMRGLIGLAHAYDEQDLRKKPFVVVGFNLVVPDDPAAQRLVIERAHASQAALYGGPVEPVEPAAAEYVRIEGEIPPDDDDEPREPAPVQTMPIDDDIPF